MKEEKRYEELKSRKHECDVIVAIFAPCMEKFILLRKETRSVIHVWGKWKRH